MGGTFVVLSRQQQFGAVAIHYVSILVQLLSAFHCTVVCLGRRAGS